MGMADDLRNLGQEMAASYDARVAGIATLRRETAEMLKGFQRDHREMATALRRSLAEAESQRRRDFKPMFRAIQQRVAALRRETSDLLAGFRQEIQEAASAWQNVASTMARKRAVIIVPPKVPKVEVIPEVPEIVEVAPPEVVKEVAPPEVVEEAPREE